MHVVIWRSRAASRLAAWFASLAIGAMACSFPVRADDSTTISAPVQATDATASSDPAPDKSGYNLFNPTPDDEMRKFTPDRPAKGFSVRTIDAGHFELETDIVNTTTSNDRGTVTRSIEALDPTVKLGLTNWMDFEATKRSYELFMRYVLPKFNGQNRRRDVSLQWMKDKAVEFSDIREKAAAQAMVRGSEGKVSAAS